MTNKLPVIGIITIVLLVFRVLFNNNPQLVLVVASINLVALLVVVLSITIQIRAKAIKKIQQSNVPKDINDRAKKQFLREVNCWTYIPLTIIYIIYMFVLCSELGNDIISIIALGLSLVDSSIADGVVNLYMKE